MNFGLQEGGNFVGPDLFVAGEECHLFYARLSDEESVEGVFVKEGQAEEFDGVGGINR